ncbi:solute carrier family 35 member f1 [Nannochloropsis gaditana]|uniref:Solute carrier family 35 member f1 n=1 Tax=Nannochloropsis gaditana TaxID=72520 RepID=W7TEC3_9STRA|nr:solute carrier family 35 member f1 [Nannochloropsis gaditana]
MPSTPPSPRKTDAHDKEEDIDLENAVEDPLLSLPVSSSTTSPLPLSSELPSDAPPPPPSSRFLFDIGLGQVLSLLITATGIFSSLLAESGRSIPATQACLTYFILSFHLCRLPRGEPLKVAWWKYLLLAAIDLEGNYLVVLSFRYTSITSVLLLDGFAIPSTMLFSWIYLRSRYKSLHFVGVLACLAGLGTVVFSDSRLLPRQDDKDTVAAVSFLSPSPSPLFTGPDAPLTSILSSSPHPLRPGSASLSPPSPSLVSSSSPSSFPPALLGDLLCLLGATLYAVSNVVQEAIVKTHDPTEFLGMLGGLGTILAGVQALVLELGREGGREGGKEGWGVEMGYLVGFAVTLAIMYTLTARFLTEADATLFNLSLLTSDAYGVFYRYVALHQPVSYLYGVGFCLTLGGLGIYHVPGAVNSPHMVQRARREGEREEDRP